MSDDPHESAVAKELRWQSLCLLTLTILAVGTALSVLRSVLAPFVLAVFFTVGLSPVLDVIKRRLHASRIGAVAIAFLLGIVLIVMLSSAIAGSINTLREDNDYQRAAQKLVASAVDAADWLGILPEEVDPNSDANSSKPEAPEAVIGDSVSPPGSETDEAPTADDAAPPGKDTEQNADPVSKSPVERMSAVLTESARGLQEWLLGEMVVLFSTMSIVLIYMFFLLLGASGVEQIEGPWAIVEAKLREYVVVKTVISAFTGIAVWFVLGIYGVPLAMVFGLLTFLLNYIPNFGPIITCVLPLPIIWMHPSLSFASCVIASVLCCGVQLVSGNVIEPKIMGDSFDLHPITVLLSLMLWAAIWGFVGMLLAVPITAAIKILLERMERTRPIARVLAGDLSAIDFGDQAA